MVVTRDFDASPAQVFRAWTEAALFSRWWVPEGSGLTLLSCQIDARTGGGYRLEFGHPASEKPVAFFGRYLEVVQDARLVWTNEESPDGSTTTVTLTALGPNRTRLVLHEAFPNDEAVAASEGMDESYAVQFAQLDALLAG